MQLPEFETGKFAEFVADKQFKKALQLVMGVGDKPVLYSRELIKCLEELAPMERHNLLSWCQTPMEYQAIGELRWYVEQIARHEVGHAVVAKLLGFETGEIRLELTAANGDHVATTGMTLDTLTSTPKDLERYLEWRIIVLMAGAMSEPESVGDLKQFFSEGFEVAVSDRHKSEELFQVLLNMRGQTRQIDFARSQHKLIEKTHLIVSRNHTMIDIIAKKIANQIVNYKQVVTWTAEEFDSLPELKNLVNPLIA